MRVSVFTETVDPALTGSDSVVIMASGDGRITLASSDDLNVDGGTLDVQYSVDNGSSWVNYYNADGNIVQLTDVGNVLLQADEGMLLRVNPNGLGGSATGTTLVFIGNFKVK